MNHFYNLEIFLLTDDKKDITVLNANLIAKAIIVLYNDDNVSKENRENLISSASVLKKEYEFILKEKYGGIRFIKIKSVYDFFCLIFNILSHIFKDREKDLKYLRELKEIKIDLIIEKNDNDLQGLYNDELSNDCQTVTWSWKFKPFPQILKKLTVAFFSTVTPLPVGDESWKQQTIAKFKLIKQEENSVNSVS